MGFDFNKYCSIIAASLLFVIILFVNLRICFSHSLTLTTTKEYQGEGCDKLKYMNLHNDDGSTSNCPGEGTYAIAQHCEEYIECVKMELNSTIHLIDNFQICDEGKVFNGTGCGEQVQGGGKEDCVQKHCKIVEVKPEKEAESELQGIEETTIVFVSIDEEEMNGTETRSNNSTTNSANKLYSPKFSYYFSCVTISFLIVVNSAFCLALQRNL